MKLPAGFNENDFFYNRASHENGINFFGNWKDIPATIDPSYVSYGIDDNQTDIPYETELVTSLPFVISDENYNRFLTDVSYNTEIREKILDSLNSYFIPLQQTFKLNTNLFSLLNTNIVFKDKEEKEYVYSKLPNIDASDNFQYQVKDDSVITGLSKFHVDLNDNNAVYRVYTDEYGKKSYRTTVKDSNNTYTQCSYDSNTKQMVSCSPITLSGSQVETDADNLVRQLASIDMNLYPNYSPISSQIPTPPDYVTGVDKIADIIMEYYTNLCINKQKAQTYMKLVDDIEINEEIYKQSINNYYREYTNMLNISGGILLLIATIYNTMSM